MNLVVSFGYISKPKYYKRENEGVNESCLTFRLYDKKDNYLYCFTGNLELIDFILENLKDENNFVSIEGKIKNYKVRDKETMRLHSNYCIVVTDIQFLSENPVEQFDITNNIQYRNWRMVNNQYKFIVGENDDEYEAGEKNYKAKPKRNKHPYRHFHSKSSK